MNTTLQKEVEDREIIKKLKPDKKIYYKLLLQAFIIWFLSLGFLYGFIKLISLDLSEDIQEIDFLSVAVPWIFGITVLGLVVAIVCIFLYIPTISYSFSKNEAIVDRGFITISHKVVPYRNVTHFEQKRGFFDRLIGGSDFGTIVIETAGISGKSHPEQKMIGVTPIKQETKYLHNIISKMKGQAAVTGDINTNEDHSSDTLLEEILITLKKIAKKIDE